jgi:hypothetical protein
VQHFGVNLVTAYPPQLGARFRYFERLRPQPSFSNIVDRAIARDPEFRPHQLGEMMRLVTVEGEYGAWVAMQGWRDGRAVKHIGAVFMDEFATVLESIAIIPEHFYKVERLSFELTRSQRFEISSRPRRFFYVPPPGWQAIASGPTASWYPLDFPNNLSIITVPPASVVEGSADSAVDAAFAEAGAGLSVDTTAREELTSANGNTGSLLRLSGRREGRVEPIYREVALYVVGRYAYLMRLETTNAAKLLELREVFRGVSGSFRPVPGADESRTGHAFSAHLDLFDHWAS